MVSVRGDLKDYIVDINLDMTPYDILHELTETQDTKFGNKLKELDKDQVEYILGESIQKWEREDQHKTLR